FPAAASVLGAVAGAGFAGSAVPGFSAGFVGVGAGSDFSVPPCGAGFASGFAPSGFGEAGAAPVSGFPPSAGFPGGAALSPGLPPGPAGAGFAGGVGSTTFV